MSEGYNFQFRACAEYLWLWLAIDCHQDAHRCEFSIEGRSFSLQDRFMSVILTPMLASDSPLATHEKWAALLRRCFKRKGGKKKGLWHRELLDPTSGMIWDSSADWRLSMLFQEKNASHSSKVSHAGRLPRRWVSLHAFLRLASISPSLLTSWQAGTRIRDLPHQLLCQERVPVSGIRSWANLFLDPWALHHWGFHLLEASDSCRTEFFSSE